MPTPNSSRTAIDIGTIVDDKYRIEALIGRGGMGSVFLASHARLPGKKVAIKVLHTGAEDADVVARFRREAEIAARLNHPNIVTVDDINVTDDGQPYLVLEYLQGMTLADRIAAGPLPLEQTMSIIRQVGSALAAAHREGIVHRDLKPQNIFLVQTDLGGKPVEIAKVLDFGISKIRGSQTVKTQESALLGTPQYMSPEQATGHHESVDQRTDIFAMGAIVHEMLSGTPAFTGASIPEVVFKVVYEPAAAMPETIPPEISGAVKRAMAKAQPERFPSMSSFVEALTGMPLASPREITPPDPPSEFAAGSKHTYNHKGEAHASTLASGDHGESIAKALHTTSHDGGAGMASTALGVAVPKPVGAAPLAPRGVGADAKTVDTLTPNAQQSLQGVAAQARANKVATDSRGIWRSVLFALPVATVAVLAFVMFTGDKKSAYRSDTSGGARGSAGVAQMDTGNAAPRPPTAEPVKNLLVTPPTELHQTGSAAPTPPPTNAVPPVTPPTTTKTGDKPVEKPGGKGTKTAKDKTVADTGDEENAKHPVEPARAAYKADNVNEALRLLKNVMNNYPESSLVSRNAHYLRGRIYCETNKVATGMADQRWLAANGFADSARNLQALCNKYR